MRWDSLGGGRDRAEAKGILTVADCPLIRSPGPAWVRSQRQIMDLELITNISAPDTAGGKIIGTDSVLIADDDAISRSMLQSCLQKWGLSVSTAKDGLYAWHELQKPDAPSLLILDWMMPGFSGIELCRKIRARKTSHYPYVLRGLSGAYLA